MYLFFPPAKGGKGREREGKGGNGCKTREIKKK